jgi:urease accessory protein
MELTILILEDIPITMNISQLSLLRLMNLMSPTLPIGGFSYSQGIEQAIENNWISDIDTAQQWLENQLFFGLLYTDLPILIRLYESTFIGDKDQALEWSNFLLACRETRELRQEEINRGRSLTKIIESLESSAVSGWSKITNTNHLSGYALISNVWKIPIDELLLGYSWSWLENQVSAIVKIIPLGQTEGQLLLNKLVKEIPEVISKSKGVAIEDIGMTQPAFAIASSLHETQYTRIFRS